MDIQYLIQYLIAYLKKNSLNHEVSFLKINISEDITYDMIKYMEKMNCTAEKIFRRIDRFANSKLYYF